MGYQNRHFLDFKLGKLFRVAFLLCALLNPVTLRAEVQMDWFEHHLTKLQERLDVIEKYRESHDPNEVAKVSEAIAKIRTPFFDLLCLMEIFEDKYEPLAGLRKKVKLMEDNLGIHNDLEEQINLLESAAPGERSRRRDPKFLETTLRDMRVRQSQSRRDIIQTLENEDWISSDRLKKEADSEEGKHPGERAADRIRRKLNKVEWDSKKNERDYIIEEMISFIKKKLLTPNDVVPGKKPTYDLADIEGPMGMHKRRRMDRKLGMRMSALKGLFVLTNEPLPKAYADVLDDPIAQGKYAYLEEPMEGKRHIFVPWAYFLELNKSVATFGRAKTFGAAMQYWLPQILFLEGFGEAATMEEAKKWAKEIIQNVPDYVPPVKLAGAAYKRLLAPRKGTGDVPNTVFEALIESLEAQIGMGKGEDCRRILTQIKNPALAKAK